MVVFIQRHVRPRNTRIHLLPLISSSPSACVSFHRDQQYFGVLKWRARNSRCVVLFWTAQSFGLYDYGLDLTDSALPWFGRRLVILFELLPWLSYVDGLTLYLSSFGYFLCHGEFLRQLWCLAASLQCFRIHIEPMKAFGIYCIQT